MSKQQPEALRLAEMLTADEWPGSVTAPAGGATAEPRWKSEDFEVTHYPPMPTTGMRVGMPRGVKVTHRPTGLFAVSEDERSQHRNREVAWNKLQEMLAAAPTPAAQAAGSVQEDAARWLSERDNVLHSFWVLLGEAETQADNDNNPLLKHQVEGFYRQWNALNGSALEPRWMTRAARKQGSTMNKGGA